MRRLRQSAAGPSPTGGIYELTRHWPLMASNSSGLQAPRRSETTAYYASLQFTN